MAAIGRRSKSLDRFKPTAFKSALVPSTALTAVPKTKVDSPNNQWGMNQSLASTGGTLPRLFATQRPPVNEDVFSDPESSLYDYQQMDDAGYSTVEFGTWPRRGGNNSSKRTSKRDVAAETTPGLYHVLETDPHDLYATPNKPKFRKSVVIEDEIMPNRNERELQGASLRTTQDVREAMQAVHDMEDTMPKGHRKSKSLTLSGNKRGSGRKTKPKHYGSHNNLDKQDEEELANFLNEPELRQKKTKARKARQPMSNQEVIEEPMMKADGQNVNMNMLSNARHREKPIEDRKARSDRHSARTTIHTSLNEETIRIKEKNMQVAMENERLLQNNEEMQKELQTLREVATAVSEGDAENANSMLFKKTIEELKEENEHLKSSVHRVTHELSQYQAKYRPLTDKERSKLQGLPSNGPIPSWLINKKYLAPLFLAYDDEIRDKNNQIHEYKYQLEDLKEKAGEIIEENKRLRIQGGHGNEIGQVGSMEWQQLQEQARLVLEENQILMEQIEVLQNKTKDMQNGHLLEIARLTKRLTISETERMELDKNFEGLKITLRELKHKNDVLVMSTESQVSAEQHITTIANLKRSLNEDREFHDRETETLKNKLKAAEIEQKNLARQVADVTAENRQLCAQMKTLERSISKSQQKIAVFHKAIEQSENKEMITQEQLANIIKVAELTALERDTYAKAAKDQHQETKKTVNKMLQGSVAVGKLEERLKMYKLKAAAKLTSVAEKLKDQDDNFQSQKEEYEREIKYLRLVISEKEQLLNSVVNEKKSVEEDLENMWQAANSENIRLKDTMRKTRKFPGNVIDDEDEVLKLPADDH